VEKVYEKYDDKKFKNPRDGSISIGRSRSRIQCIVIEKWYLALITIWHQNSITLNHAKTRA